MFKHIIIHGAGAIGSIIGALLNDKCDVILVGRGEHIKAIKSNGLTLSGRINNNFRIKATDSVPNIQPNTLIIFSTKIYNLEESILQINKLILDDTIILFIQNGVNIKDLALHHLHNTHNPTNFVRAVTTIGSTFLEPGKIVYNDLGQFIIEESYISRDIISLFRDVNINVQVTNDITKCEWKKLIFNCITSPLTALLGVKNNELACCDVVHIQKKLTEECLIVAQKEGIAFNEDIVSECNTIFNKSSNISSMLQDVIKSKKTEIDYLNGYIVSKARQHDVEVPYNELIYNLIKAKEFSYKKS